MAFSYYFAHALLSMIFAQPMFQTCAFAQIWGGGKPIDGGKMWKGKRIFGDNKTWKGLIIGTIGGTITGIAVGLIFDGWFFYDFFPFEYPLYIGFVLSIGTNIADLLGSFVKRRMDIGSGGAFVPWDQMGYIIIGILLALPFLFPMETIFWFYFGFLAIFNIFMHFFVSSIAYKLGVKKTWY